MSGIQLSPSPQKFAIGVLAKLKEYGEEIAVVMATPRQRKILEAIKPAGLTLIFVDQATFAAILQESVGECDFISYIFKNPNLIPEFEQMMRGIAVFPQDELAEDYRFGVALFTTVVKYIPLFMGIETPEINQASVRCRATSVDTQSTFDAMGLFHAGVSNTPLATVPVYRPIHFHDPQKRMRSRVRARDMW